MIILVEFYNLLIIKGHAEACVSDSYISYYIIRNRLLNYDYHRKSVIKGCNILTNTSVTL